MSKKNTVKATTLAPISDLAEFIEVCDNISRLDLDRDTKNLIKEKELQAVNDKHDPALLKLDNEITTLTERAELFASGHRDLIFPKGRKTGETSQSTYSYRMGQPQLKTLKGWTWDKVVALLKKTRRKAYLITRIAADKDAIRLHVKDKNLPKIGLTIFQEEKFYVERKTSND